MKKPISKAKKTVAGRGRFSKKSEPDFYHASRKKNLDNMKIFISYPKVKEIIEETRKRLKIPAGGLSDGQSEQWHRQDDIQCDEIMNTPEFIKQELDIKKKCQEKKIALDQSRKLLHELYLQVPVHYLYAQIWKIIRQFNAPDNYERHIYNYILYGTINASVTNYSIGPFKADERLHDVKRLPITVYTKLTDNDLRDLKLQINQYFGGKRLTFIQDVKDIDRDLEAERLLAEKEYDFATGKENKLSYEDVAERVFGNRKKKGEVLKARERLGKLRKTRFGKQ